MTATTASAPTPAEESRPGSRADRARRPRARDVLTETAVEFGVCVRPIPMRRVDLATGETQVKDIPCGSTRAAVCPSCADKARRLRAQQCREGWHLTEDPDLTPDPATPEQRDLVTVRADITDAMGDAADAGDDLTAEACRESAAACDGELADTGVRGTLDRLDGDGTPRRVRSTRRRQDAPDLPSRPSNGSTLGRTYRDQRTGKEFRPSMFVTLTLDSYGPVRRDDSTPLDPATYDYTRAARDALHFGKLVDRWVQNLRRVAGYDLQYFATVEPQKRGAPHAHFAIRGTLPRVVVKQVTAATYAQVWWPAVTEVVYPEGPEPVWDATASNATAQDPEAAPGGFIDPITRERLMTWEQALDAVAADPDAQPRHVAVFGEQVDVKGVIAGSPQAEQCIGYLVKYLVKDLGADLDPTPDADPDEANEGAPTDVKAAKARRAEHIAGLVEVLRFEPCSPSCPNWLRYGIEPKNLRATMRAGCCKAKAHKASHLGYGGRRVLVSRKWTAKDLADHRHDRKAHVLAILGRSPDGTPVSDGDGDGAESGGESSATGGAVLWEPAKQTDPDVPPLSRRLLLGIAHASRWRAEYRTARDALAANSAITATAADVDPAA
jgi:hypothetical protein